MALESTAAAARPAHSVRAARRRCGTDVLTPPPPPPVHTFYGLTSRLRAAAVSRAPSSGTQP